MSKTDAVMTSRPDQAQEKKPRKKHEPIALTSNRKYVSEAELELITGIAKRTWQKHRLFGHGPKWYKLQGAVRYDIEEVLAWIRSNVAGGESIPA